MLFYLSVVKMEQYSDIRELYAFTCLWYGKLECSIMRNYFIKCKQEVSIIRVGLTIGL